MKLCLLKLTATSTQPNDVFRNTVRNRIGRQPRRQTIVKPVRLVWVLFILGTKQRVQQTLLLK